VPWPAVHLPSTQPFLRGAVSSVPCKLKSGVNFIKSFRM
jgi:hypothetical protein